MYQTEEAENQRNIVIPFKIYWNLSRCRIFYFFVFAETACYVNQDQDLVQYRQRTVSIGMRQCCSGSTGCGILIDVDFVFVYKISF